MVKPLPKHLRAQVDALSLTVQQLVYEVALHATGIESDVPLKVDSKIIGGWRRNHQTPQDAEILRSYVYALSSTAVVERCAVGIAAIAGRTAREMDAFFEWEGTKHKLEWLRALARRRQ